MKDHFKDQVFAVKVGCDLYISTDEAVFVPYILIWSVFAGSAKIRDY